jgi:hypothetical protein
MRGSVAEKDVNTVAKESTRCGLTSWPPYIAWRGPHSKHRLQKFLYFSFVYSLPWKHTEPLLSNRSLLCFGYPSSQQISRSILKNVPCLSMENNDALKSGKILFGSRENNYNMLLKSCYKLLLLLLISVVK